MPVLNWLLVQKNNLHDQKIVPLTSDKATESSLVLNSLQKHPLVLDAQHNFVLDPASLPNNRSFPKDWQLQTPSRNHGAAMNLPAAWSITQGSKHITIGVVDQFTADGRFTFLDRFSDCKDRVDFFDPQLGMPGSSARNLVPHGEIILLALGACNNHEAYSSGIDWQAKILAAQRPSLGHAETFLTALLASQINVCDESILPCPKNVSLMVSKKKPDILLLPFGGDAPELLQFTTDMLFTIRSNGIIVITAAGNDESNAQNYFPGGSPEAINVGALSRSYERAMFSNWGPTVDLLAPGAKIEFIYPNGPKEVDGTSLSAAYVAGTVSLIKAINPTLSQKAIEFILMDSARPLSCDQYCHALPAGNSEGCKSLCCTDLLRSCGKLALDVGRAITLANSPQNLPPLIDLNVQYMLFLRDEDLKKPVTVTNEGDRDTRVVVRTFDDNIKVTPSEFHLAKKTSDGHQQQVMISVRKEPYRRQTYKVDFVAEYNGKPIDRADLYLEYIPKK